MAGVRVWVPLTLRDLARHHAAGELPAGQERFTAAQDEESEYAALVEAAAASAGLLDAGTHAGPDAAPRRRVVLVAEAIDPDGAIPFRHVVAVHADPAPDADPRDDLAWYAVQEVPGLLADAGLGPA